MKVSTFRRFKKRTILEEEESRSRVIDFDETDSTSRLPSHSSQHPASWTQNPGATWDCSLCILASDVFTSHMFFLWNISPVHILLSDRESHNFHAWIIVANFLSGLSVTSLSLSKSASSTVLRFVISEHHFPHRHFPFTTHILSLPDSGGLPQSSPLPPHSSFLSASTSASVSFSLSLCLSLTHTLLSIQSYSFVTPSNASFVFIVQVTPSHKNPILYAPPRPSPNPYHFYPRHILSVWSTVPPDFYFPNYPLLETS